MVLEKILESSLDSKEIKPVHPKGNQLWIFFGRTDVEAETAILWPPDVKNWLLKIPWCWGRLKARGEGDDRGWDGWMASLTQWTWVWASSERCPDWIQKHLICLTTACELGLGVEGHLKSAYNYLHSYFNSKDEFQTFWVPKVLSLLSSKWHLYSQAFSFSVPSNY